MSNCQREEEAASLSRQGCTSKCYRNVLVWEQGRRKEEWNGGKKKKRGKIIQSLIEKIVVTRDLTGGFSTEKAFYRLYTRSSTTLKS